MSSPSLFATGSSNGMRRADDQNAAALDAAGKYMDAVPGIDPAIVKEERDAEEKAAAAAAAAAAVEAGPPGGNVDNGPGLRAGDMGLLQSVRVNMPDDGSGGPNSAHHHASLMAAHGHLGGGQPKYQPAPAQYMGAADARTMASAAFIHMHDPDAGPSDHTDVQSQLGHQGPGNGQGPNAHIASFMSNDRLTNTTSLGKRRVRLGWTREETQYLMEGCKRHGVGNWKKILTDPSFRFNGRTAVDLKDRFRTSFPDEYARLYPNAKTHKIRRRGHEDAAAAAAANGWNAVHGSAAGLQHAGATGPSGLQLVKINRKERRAFTKEEDARLLEGFNKHGPAWSKIQRDHTLNFGERRSTDLRDRFRNAFPEEYAKAGYKGRSRRQSSASIGSGGAHGGSGPSLLGSPDTTQGVMIKDDGNDGHDPTSVMGGQYLSAGPNPYQFQNMYYAPHPHSQAQPHLLYRPNDQ